MTQLKKERDRVQQQLTGLNAARVRSAQRARWATVKSPEESRLTVNRSYQSFAMNAPFHCDQWPPWRKRRRVQLFFFPVWES
jgi:hypothetical protein